MNTYTFEEISVGKVESFQTSICKSDMDMFRKITGDENPLHCDEAFANQHGYSGCVAYGMLTASYLSTLAGMYLPGERSLIHEVEVKFIKPVVMEKERLGLTVTGTVSEKNDTFRRITIKVAIVTETGEKVLRGTMKAGVAE